VILDKIETGGLGQLGPQLVALQAWKELGFSPMLEEPGLSASQIATAQLLVANRLIELWASGRSLIGRSAPPCQKCWGSG
jgi:hypothetical protein